MDWEAWVDRVHRALRQKDPALGQFFAPGAHFLDPEVPLTTDLSIAERQLRAAFTDWDRRVLSVRGDEGGVAFEWAGRGTLYGTARVEILGCTVVDVDEAGLVTRWRDYFDVKELERQIGSTDEVFREWS